MKHAILIMAHKHFDHLKHLIEYFSRDCFVFVHVDKRSLFKREEIETLQSFPQVVKVYRKFAVHWGGFSILKCEKFLLKESYRLCDATYFHLISGQDYPIKPLSFFLNFFIYSSTSLYTLDNSNFSLAYDSIWKFKNISIASSKLS